VLLAFWAFAGFENLTFLNGELADPRRDFLPVSAMALATYSLLTVLLTVAIGTRIPRGDVDPVTGLLQLAQLLHPRHLVVGVVTVIAICAMTLNAVAWVWGISRLIVGAAHATIVPQWLSVVTTGGVPRRAVLLLGALLAAGTTVLALHPDAVVEAVAAASAIFVVLCVMSIVAYVRVRRLTARTALNVPVLVMVVISLVQSGWRASYAVVTLAAAVIWQLSRSTRVRTATHLGDAFTRAPTTQGRRHPT
jgi:amino acid efflux transporter